VCVCNNSIGPMALHYLYLNICTKMHSETGSSVYSVNSHIAGFHRPLQTTDVWTFVSIVLVLVGSEPQVEFNLIQHVY